MRTLQQISNTQPQPDQDDAAEKARRDRADEQAWREMEQQRNRQNTEDSAIRRAEDTAKRIGEPPHDVQKFLGTRL